MRRAHRPPGGPPTLPEDAGSRWRWPIDRTGYDRTLALSPAEQAAVAEVEGRRGRWPRDGRWPPETRAALHRLVRPLEDVLTVTGLAPSKRHVVLGLVVRAMHETHTTYWAWGREDWLRLLQASRSSWRQHLLAAGYLLGDFADLHFSLRQLGTSAFAARIFGVAAVDAAVTRLRDEVRGWGYSAAGMVSGLPTAVAALLLVSRSPYLEDITAEAIAVMGAAPTSRATRHALWAVARALVALGYLRGLPPSPLTPRAADPPAGPATDGVPAEWRRWCERWRDTSTLQQRQGVYHRLLVAGRWLAQCHPDLASPAAWTREAAAQYVAAVDRMTVGQWTHPRANTHRTGSAGQPLAAKTKDQHLGTMRTFFRDCQEWGWLVRRFDPGRAFATPRSIRALLGPAPRVIADDIWGKLLWAGLNLTTADLTGARSGARAYLRYPLLMVRTLAVVWLFTGLRADELRRLPVGCVRWQQAPAGGPGPAVESGAADTPPVAVCWLDVPVNKTSTAFTKPVDAVVGEAIEAWERDRPPQPAFRDRKTGQPVRYLFAYRGKPIGQKCFNQVLIPLLCRKAGVPTRDARGRITSYRARSTIASQLANAKEPPTLLELMEWLGHRQPALHRARWRTMSHSLSVPREMPHWQRSSFWFRPTAIWHTPTTIRTDGWSDPGWCQLAQPPLRTSISMKTT